MPALDIRALEKTYAGGVKAVRGIDLTVNCGDFFALLGPNGAGKSTVIGIVTSLVNKSSGRVSVFGHDIDTQLEDAKRCLGLVPQEFNFSQFETCLQIVVTQAGYYGVSRTLALERAHEMLGKLGLWEKRNTQARLLSGGMKRRLMIARALMHRPKLLVLDEPTAGVDIELRRSMWDYLRELNRQGTTIVLTTHYLEEAESLCRTIGIINHGRIVENTSMKALLAQLELETIVLDISADSVVPESLGTTPLRLREDGCLEIDVARNESLNVVFAALSRAGVKVLSMRNKSNRLEELFLRLVDAGQTDTAATELKSC